MRRAAVPGGFLVLDLLLVPGSAAAAPDLADLARKCQQGRQKDCAKLSEIARTSRDGFLRARATELLTDGTVLTLIVRTDSLSVVRRAALKNPNLTDPGVFAERARQDDDEDVRLAAVSSPRLADQAVFAEVAARDRSRPVRKAAYERITDQAMLVRFVTSPTTSETLDWAQREEALDRVTDPALLVELCAKAPMPSWRARVLKRVTDLDAVLALMVRAPKEDQAGVREKLSTFAPTDGASVAKLVHACFEWSLNTLCRKVIASIGTGATTASHLVDIAIGIRDVYIAQEALQKLSDDASVLQVATQAQEPRVRAAALGRVAAPPAPVANAVLASLLAAERWDVVHEAWTHGFALNPENRTRLTAAAGARRGFVSNAARAMLTGIPARRWARLSVASGVKVEEPKSALGYLPETLAPGPYAFQVSFSREEYDPVTRGQVTLSSRSSRPLSGTLLAGKCYAIESGKDGLIGQPTWSPSLGPARCQ